MERNLIHSQTIQRPLIVDDARQEIVFRVRVRFAAPDDQIAQLHSLLAGVVEAWAAEDVK